jgi:hypothetical protein
MYRSLLLLISQKVTPTLLDVYCFRYADDVTSIVRKAAEQELEGALYHLMGQLHVWFRSNGLALNMNKTCYMTFKLNGHARPPLGVCAGGASIEYSM